MRPLSDRERMVLLAIGRLERGDSPTQAAGYIATRYGITNPVEAADIVSQAQVSQANAVGVSLAQETDTVGSVAGNPNRNTPFVVEATVEFNVPGKGVEYRTLRFEDVTAETTLEELGQRIEANADDWLEQSLPEGSTFGWTTRYIL